MRKYIYLTLLIFVLFMFSCASDDVVLGEKFVPIKNIPKGKALVYIYRPTMWAALLSYDIFVNGNYLIKLPANSYFPYFANPGKNVFFAETEVKKQVALNAEAGKTYYLLCSVTPGFWVGHPYFEFVKEKEGMEDLPPLKIAINNPDKDDEPKKEIKKEVKQEVKQEVKKSAAASTSKNASAAKKPVKKK
jgi:Protein of unknown function (DUF2846)